MSFVSIERNPVVDEDGKCNEDCHDSSDGSSKSKCHSDDFFAYKGAAVGLHQETYRRRISCVHTNSDLKDHLKKMLSVFRKVDYLNIVVKLQCTCLPINSHYRYIAIICSTGSLGTVESAILGFDICEGKITIGLVLEIWGAMQIILDGDGGFKVLNKDGEHLFKPVSVQALWAVCQRLNKAVEDAKKYNYFLGGLTHTWVNYYQSQLVSSPAHIREWKQMEDIENRKTESAVTTHTGSQEEKCEVSLMEEKIKVKLKSLMSKVDLETVTVLELRRSLEEFFERDLRIFRRIIETETLNLYGQMDSPSKILDHVYLGSVFNASNLEELENNNVTHILNVTREIDNFFLEKFVYNNVREVDEELTQLLPHWEHTHRFINKAKSNGSCCLVHCKMGVSRSASTVIAYAMKEYSWKLSYALEFVKSKRSCVQPNPGFMKQLEEYEGILEASAHRHSANFNNHTNPIKQEQESPALTPTSSFASPDLTSTHRISTGSRRLPLSQLDESSLPESANQIPENDKQINVESDLFYYKPKLRKDSAKSTSILSNVSNRSPISSSFIAGGICSESGSATEGTDARQPAPSKTTSSIRLRHFRPDFLEICDSTEFGQQLSRPAQQHHKLASLSPPVIFGTMSAKSDPCLEYWNPSFPVSSPTTSPFVPDPAVVPPKFEEFAVTPDDDEKENNNQAGGVTGVTHRKRPHSRYRDDKSWIRLNSSEEAIPVTGREEMMMEGGEEGVRPQQVDGSAESLPELRTRRRDTASCSKDDVAFKRHSLNEARSTSHQNILQSLAWSKSSRSRSTSGGADMDTIFSESPTSPTTNEDVGQQLLGPLPVERAEPFVASEHRRAASWGVYESEQIDFQPGLVMRTKQVIEATGSGAVPSLPGTSYIPTATSSSSSTTPGHAVEREGKEQSTQPASLASVVVVREDDGPATMVTTMEADSEVFAVDSVGGQLVLDGSSQEDRQDDCPSSLRLTDGPQREQEFSTDPPTGSLVVVEEDSILPVSELVGRFTPTEVTTPGNRHCRPVSSGGSCSEGEGGLSTPSPPRVEAAAVGPGGGDGVRFGLSKFYMTM